MIFVPDMAIVGHTRTVTSLRSYHEIPVYNPETLEAEGWMNLTRAAAFLGISPKTLRLAAERGEIEALHPLQDGPWLFKRSALQTQAATHLVERASSPTERCGSLRIERANHPAPPVRSFGKVAFATAWSRISVLRSTSKVTAVDQPNSSTPFIAVNGPNNRHRSTGVTSP